MNNLFIYSSEEQELCVQQRLSAEQRLKTMEEEMAPLRVQVEREREEIQKVKNSLSEQEEEVKRTKKLQEDIQKTANMCNTELVSPHIKVRRVGHSITIIDKKL